MTDVTSLAAANSDYSKSTASKKSLAGDLDSFLTLLTSQLKNQDPLSPMDSTQFTNQLVQFANVEQQINANTNLETLIGLSQASIGATAVGYLGKEVQAESSTMPLQDGSAKFTYTLPKDASQCLVVIKDSSGKVVHTENGENTAGTYHVTWDGKDAYGNQLDDGAYSLEIQATDTDGQTMDSIYTSVFGKATAVANDGDTIMVAAGPVLFDMNKIISVREIQTASTGTSTDDASSDEAAADAAANTTTTTTETNG